MFEEFIRKKKRNEDLGNAPQRSFDTLESNVSNGQNSNNGSKFK